MKHDFRQALSMLPGESDRTYFLTTNAYWPMKASIPPAGFESFRSLKLPNYGDVMETVQSKKYALNIAPAVGIKRKKGIRRT